MSRHCPMVALLLFTLGLPAVAQDDILVSLDAWADLDGVVHVRWITAQGDPAKCSVEYGPTPELGMSVEEDPSSLRGGTNSSDPGTGWANNHRVDIDGVETWPVHLRVVGDTRGGKSFVSDTVTVDRPVLPATRADTARIAVRLHPGDWKLARIPYTLGVPFPRGELGDPARVRVLVGGEEIASQAVAVTRWRSDQSVKWLRVDFLAPADEAEAALEYGASVTRQAYGPDIAPFGMSALPLPVFARLVDSEGKVYRDEVDEQALEEAGPVKSVLRIDGHHVAEDGARLWEYTLRFHVWEGLGCTRVDYTVENDNTGQEFTAIQSLELGLRGTGSETVTVGAGETTVTLQEGERVLQREDFEWITEPAGDKGKRIEGVVDLGGGDRALLRNFWEQWPASVELRGGIAHFGLCPRLPEGFYAGRKDEDKLYYQIRDGLHTVRQGFSKTWELWLCRADAEAAESLIGERPVASVPPQWVEESGALQGLAVSTRDQFPDYDEALEAGIRRFLGQRDASREYGMMNFGDWHGERTWNWGNLEYDLGHGFLTQFARTGTPEFWRRAEEAVRHQRDVDTRHHADDPRRVGQQWTHSIGHTAGYYPPDYKDMKVYASPGWSDNRGHVWCQGMFEHYLMGGDRRSYETARMIADNYGGPGTTNYLFYNAREPGWVGKMQMAAFLATEDPYYLNAARIILEAVHAKSLETGDHGFHYHKLPGGHCDCPEDQKHYGEAGFMLGVQMTAQKMYYDETGDETIAQDIVKTARFIAETMWVPEALGFRYTSCPNTGAGPGRAWIQMQGMAFAARHAQDEELAEVCRKSMAAGWSSLPTGGKSAGYTLCASAQALHELGQIPGPSFREYLERIDRALRSPARRLLPTLVANPDFEENIAGWPSRGWKLEQSLDEWHSGHASLRIFGTVANQNEYVNTSYDTGGSPYEITWLKPGMNYRLSAWLKVNRISEGAPGPSMRIQFRDASGSRGSATTNAYDLAQSGTWQKLTVDFETPDYNDRNYLALNTRTKDSITVDMLLDDISIVPVDLADDESSYDYLRLAVAEAELVRGAKLVPHSDLPGVQALQGPGTARWIVESPDSSVYFVWVKVLGPGEIPPVCVAEDPVTPPATAAEATWVSVGPVRLPAGKVTVEMRELPASAVIGGLLLTTDPSSGL